MGLIELLNNPFIQGGLCFTLGILFQRGLDIFINKDRDRQNREILAFEEAARKFVSVIARELVGVSSKPNAASIDNIRVAIIEFKRYLDEEQKKQIEETWKKYETLENNRSSQVALYGHSMGASIARELLEDLLKFTEKHGKNS